MKILLHSWVIIYYEAYLLTINNITCFQLAYFWELEVECNFVSLFLNWSHFLKHSSYINSLDFRCSYSLIPSLVLFRQMSDVVGGRGVVGLVRVVGGKWAVCSERLNQQTTTAATKTAIEMMTGKPAHGEINVCDLPIMWVILLAFRICVYVCVCQRVRISMGAFSRERCACVRLVITAVSISGRQARLRCQFHKQFTQTAKGAQGHRGESHSICQLLRPRYIFRTVEI